MATKVHILSDVFQNKVKAIQDYLAPAVLLVTLLVMGVFGGEEGVRRGLLLAGFRTGEVLADEGGDCLFLLAEPDAFEAEEEDDVFLDLFLVPLGGAGEVGFFFKHVFRRQAFLKDLFLQYLQLKQLLARHPVQSPHLPLFLGWAAGRMGLAAGMMGRGAGGMGSAAWRLGWAAGRMGCTTGRMGWAAGRIGWTSGRMGCTTGRMGWAAGRMGWTSGRISGRMGWTSGRMG